MAIKKIRMRPEGVNDYADVLHPETSADQVKVSSGGTVEDLKIDLVTTNTNLSNLQGEVSTHVADDVSHITSTERTDWNSKQGELPVENRRKITFGTSEPSGGVDGDIYFQYE